MYCTNLSSEDEENKFAEGLFEELKQQITEVQPSVIQDPIQHVSMFADQLSTITTLFHCADFAFRVYVLIHQGICYRFDITIPPTSDVINEYFSIISSTMKFSDPKVNHVPIKSVVWAIYQSQEQGFYLRYPCDWV